MVESHFEHWDRLLFRDYLIDHPNVAKEYANLKMRLCSTHENDRVSYTQAKSDFIRRVIETAKRYYRNIKQADAPDALPQAGETRR